MDNGKSIPRWYLIPSIIYSSLTLLSVAFLIILGSSLSGDAQLSIFYAIAFILLPISFIWFILNIVMLVIFIKSRREKIVISLPILYLLIPLSGIIPFGFFINPFIYLATLIISIRLLFKK